MKRINLKIILIIGIIFSILFVIFGFVRLASIQSYLGGYVFIFYGIIGAFIFGINVKKGYQDKKKIILFFVVCYFLIGISGFSLYVYTHTPHTDGIVPPAIYIRVIDNNENPVMNAECVADIETENFTTDNKPLENINIMKELECYGREKCDDKGYLGYYRLNITNQSYEPWNILFLHFWKPTNVIEGDFEIKIVCRTPTSVSYTIINQTNFPCSPIPLEGNYIAPSFVCSDSNDMKEERAYVLLNDEKFDEFDKKAVSFIIDNYQGKTILANIKLSVALDNCNYDEAYSCGVNPVGLIQDTKGYGDPYVFNEFMIADCERKLELINEFNIDLILSRFELDKCEFMTEIYNNQDFIYEVLK
ncbi:MAG: hypothetical protein M1416_03025 [Candidatus Pacearchaeota archaeon]|nr:hypothetical protein [Candidatus Pacearchaeota archaeon]